MISNERLNDIRRDPDNQNWNSISWSSSLSENLIREFQNKVIWKWISFRQKLSKEFIVEFSNKIDFTALLQNNLIDDQIKDFCRMFI